MSYSKRLKSSMWQSSDGFGKPAIHMSNKEGVYVIYNCDILNNSYYIIYIGRSLNLAERWKSHPTYHKAIKDGCFPAVKWKHCNNSAQLEQQLIKRLKPKYNKQLLCRTK